jgi:hypothetical protein
VYVNLVANIVLNITVRIMNCSISCSGPASSVGIAADHGLDGLGIESRWERGLSQLSRPTLWPTQPPVQWVSGLSRGRKRPGRDADPSPTSSAEV